MDITTTERGKRLVAAVKAFLGRGALLPVEEIRDVLEGEIREAGPEALEALIPRLAEEPDWDYSPPDPLAPRIHHALAARFLHPDSEVPGSDQLALVAAAPVVLFANHLSYSDANVIDVMLRRAGAEALALRAQPQYDR